VAPVGCVPIQVCVAEIEDPGKHVVHPPAPFTAEQTASPKKRNTAKSMNRIILCRKGKKKKLKIVKKEGSFEKKGKKSQKHAI
jgi:hypothetical protein